MQYFLRPPLLLSPDLPDFTLLSTFEGEPAAAAFSLSATVKLKEYWTKVEIVL